MIKFLIHRPVAVIMTFVALLTLGLVATGLLPVSLMPDMAIPEITIQVNRPGESVRQVEDGVVAPLRYHLMQLPHLDDMTSESRDGRALIRLRFGYGADINYAFIDVNEKVDAAMRNLPSDMERPAIIKASASDLPVFYINLWRENADEAAFMELSTLARAVLIKRLEQLPEVAMVDVTGHLEPELYIAPNETLLQALGLSHYDITRALEQNNLSMGSLQVADGQYLFNIRFANALHTVDDVKDIRLRVGSRFMKLSELAEIGLRPRQQEGAFLKDSETALSLAVIKQADARMDELKASVQGMLDRFAWEYPEIRSQIIRDQTTLLSHSISNLRDNLIFGGLLAFIILFFFLKDGRAPWLIGISIPTALVISLLFFHLAGLSINIISLSGLILGIGMMIDNSIIVIDNITQYTDKGETLATACIRGTNEIIRPLISSVLTTCAVFVPLVFLSGISGALFYDQALAVAIGLVASLLVAITIIPVLYHLFSLRAERKGRLRKGRLTLALQKLNLFKAEDSYEKGFNWVFRHRKACLLLGLTLIVPALLLAWLLPKERFPSFQHSDILVAIDWNERINLEENCARVKQLHANVADWAKTSTSYAGTQKYLLHRDLDQSVSEALLYFDCQNEKDLGLLERRLADQLAREWPGAVVEFRVPETLFEQLFQQEEALLVARVRDNRLGDVPEFRHMQAIAARLNADHPDAGIMPPAAESYIEISARPDRLLLYEVDPAALYERLRAALNAWQVGVLHTGSQYIPMVIGNSPLPVDRLLNELMVLNRQNLEIPVNALVTTRIREDYKALMGNAQGAFVPLDFHKVPGGAVSDFMGRLTQELNEKHQVDASFSGSWLGSRQLMRELWMVLLVSLALLYFILAAQFESLRQPFILLLEIPLDIAGALFLLWLFGGSINLMSMIGIIVMSGIVVNDSILKIDTINRLRREGLPLLEAIREGGHRRLKPIIMTSITTILALVPVLWGSGMGSELQRPLALTVIGGMVLGTVVSLYFIPLCYYYLCRNQKPYLINPSQ